MSGPSDYSPISSNDDGRSDNAPQQRTMPAFHHLSLAKVTLGVLLPSFFAFVILDGLWIGVVAAKMYQRHLKPVLRQQVDPFAAVGSWLLIILGCWLFAGSTGPSIRQAGAIAEVLGKGATYGFVVYGIYDLTNTATISGWSWGLALIDIAWGTFGSALIALLQAWLATCWLPKH